MLVLLCDWFEKLTDYIFGLDSSTFVQSPLWCFYYLIFDPQSLTYFLSKCSLCSHWQPGCTGHYQIIANYLCLREQRWQICGVLKKWLFLLQLLALSPCVGLYFTKAVSHGYLCRAPVSVIVVTRQRNYRGKGKV